MSKELKKQFQILRDVEGHVNPRKEWISETRASLLHTIVQKKSEQSERESSFFARATSHARSFAPVALFSQMKPVFVSMLVFLLASSGWIASASASESLPGDRLWHVKLASEKTQIVLADIAGNETKNVELQLKFATRRAEEIKTVSTEEKFNAEEKVKRTGEGLKKLKKNISSVDVVVQQAVQSQKTEEKQQVSKQAKEVNNATTQISQALEEVVDSVEADSADTDLTKEVVAVKQAVDEVGIDVVKVAVEGAENDEQRIAAQALVEEKLVSILSDADGAIDETEEVKELVETIQERTEEDEEGRDTEGDEEERTTDESDTATTTKTNTSSTAGDASTTVNVSSRVTSGTPQGIDIETKATFRQTIATILENADSTSAKVKEAVGEIKALMEVGELTQALEKAKLLRKVTAESEKTAIDIKRAVRDVTEKQLSTHTVSDDTVPQAPPVSAGTSATSSDNVVQEVQQDTTEEVAHTQ